MPKPHVGIFFLVGDELLIDSVPLSQAEEYADHLIHSRGHTDYWDDLLASGQVAGEYDEYPRGRVSYSTRDERYTLLADQHILKREDVVQQILDRMQLPPDTIRGGDAHYRVTGARLKSKDRG
jgi:hypothetical protein